ncbi:MAG TPA: polysaccharide deacetylase family protein [Longimicrobium sp.]|nr:polysaccharide deacetylase family protein [Longimicrobium sp.]
MSLGLEVRPVAVRLMKLAPLRFFGAVLPRDVISFCYHTVSDEALPHVRPMYPYKTAAQFEADLVYLKSRFRLVSYEEIAEAHRSGRQVGPNAALLTFDDGYAECHSIVRRLLLKHGVPCVFFVTTGVLDNARMLLFNQIALCLDARERLGAESDAAFRELDGELGVELRSFRGFERWMQRVGAESHPAIDRLCERLGVDVGGFLATRRPYMTREQVRELAADGFTIGGHTTGHRHLGSLPPTESRAEIVESCLEVARLTGAERVPFAFPYDAKGVRRDDLRQLRREHPFLELMFGSDQLDLDAEFLVNRILADTPPRPGRRVSNLPGYLRGAYFDAIHALLARRAGAAGAP